ncbi:uncharacterized protein TRIREDRAFT_102890 [Trichoderma reesei QM6a]|jgi:uncharacterized SAM-binding protein YcdF (DUF218 family)|uniref:Predicted protein n=2 Tax=Hypocrea jecorina TaxID=51453 RepID=G0R8K1_HYPJQ|nr:uncharacterized protein TRIREDRAFT_102890 [Trichoderma reesei QM6a]EGR52895.1 predicted protein [Trichoderma reesei QM6a]ETS06704.1 DUF218 domain-containing protein [Trichoderma reesei RUT C-30]
MTQTDQIHKDATLVYNYHKMNLPLRPASAIFCLCSLDTRIAAHAAQLYLDGIAPYLIFSGDSGVLTKGLFAEPEAVVFAAIAREMGVPDDRIIVEPRARNTGENVRFTYDMLREKGLLEELKRSLVLVQKPYMERRTYATFRKQWPDQRTLFTVSSPDLSFGEYPDARNPRELVTSIMVGDLVRIKEYPARGFQIEQEIPDEVWEAGKRLVEAGFDKHLP